MVGHFSAKKVDLEDKQDISGMLDNRRSEIVTTTKGERVIKRA